MDRKNFGKLIAALRKERLDRHSLPWTRERFSMETGIDREILVNIETGRRAILHPELLTQMADALKLSSGERKEFFLAASGVDTHTLYHHLENPKTALARMLKIMDDLYQPALLVDQYFDIVAINFLMLEIYNAKADHFFDPNINPTKSLNLILFLFSAAFEKQTIVRGGLREDFIASVIMLFRAFSLRYRLTDYYQELYSLLRGFEGFRNYIQHKPKDEHYTDNNLHITLDNPRFGMIRSIGTSVSIATTEGELKLFVLTPLDKDTVNLFAKLAQKGNYVFQSLPDWPQKPTQTGK